MPLPSGLASGGGVSKEQSEFLDRWSYNDEIRRAAFDGSIEVLPSTFYMGEFSLSNGVQAVAFKLADGTNALGLVNRFNPLLGTISNPKFFALGVQGELSVETVSTGVIDDGFTLLYTTAGDNLTFDFDFIPNSAGSFKAQYWIGANDSGNKIFDEIRIVTQAEVDAGLPIRFLVGNPYLLDAGTQLFVKFTGISFKGNAATGLPYFVSKILPYKEITIGGHIEHITPIGNDTNIFIGCDYAPDTTAGEVRRKVPLSFTDKFRVTDYKSTFTAISMCVFDFSDFGVGTVEMKHAGDDVEFSYVDGEWWYSDFKIQKKGKV